MQRRTVIWKTPEISADGLKMFACAMMLLQTIGISVVEKGLIHIDQYTQEQFSALLAEDSHLMFLAGVGSVLQLLGGMAVPLFAFLLVEGFLHTSDYRRYLLSVVLFALVSEIPYDLAVYQRVWAPMGQNALCSMAVSLLMLYFLRMTGRMGTMSGILSKLLIVAGAVAWVSLLHAEYGLSIVLLTAVFYLFYARNGWKMALGILISLLHVTGPLAFYGIWCYNEVRTDRIPRYAYYLFYPLHLLALGLISVLVCVSSCS